MTDAVGGGAGVVTACRERPAVVRGLPADVGVVLLAAADTIVATVDGVVRDVDAEVLHALRVAVRRTRSLLKLLGDVLPGGLAERYTPVFAHLAALTTPVRDLDVLLARIPGLADGLVAAAPSDLGPAVADLRRERTDAHRDLVRGLREQPVECLLADWRAELGVVVASGQSAVDGVTEPVEDVAVRCLVRTVTRADRRARAVTPDSPPERIHDLRKRCKELRYLLEAVRPLCEATAYGRAIRELKRLQDVLGAFQDDEVHRDAVYRSARRLGIPDTGTPPVTTLLALGEVAALLAREQRSHRGDVLRAVRRFLRPKTRRRILAVLP